MKHNNSLLQKRAAGLLAGYALQFLLGMTLNLFVTIPKSHPGANGKEYFTSSGHGLVWALTGGGGFALALHAYLALALMIASLHLFFETTRVKAKRWSWCAGIAAFFTVGAFFNGLSFIDYNHNASSMIMAACWLIAVGALVIGLVSDNMGTKKAA